MYYLASYKRLFHLVQSLNYPAENYACIDGHETCSPQAAAASDKAEKQLSKHLQAQPLTIWTCRAWGPVQYVPSMYPQQPRSQGLSSLPLLVIGRKTKRGREERSC